MENTNTHGIGHNSAIGDAGAQRLRSFIERVERLEEEKSSLSQDIKEIYSEAKATGFDVKTLRKIVRMRKMDADKRIEEEAMLETYMAALGMLADTPLGRAAIAGRSA